MVTRLWVVLVFSWISVYANARELEYLGGIGEKIRDIAWSSKGELFLSTESQIWRRDAEGVYHLYAGTDSGFPYEGNQEGVHAAVAVLSPRSIAFGPGDQLYFINWNPGRNFYLYAIGADGIVHTVAGNGQEVRLTDTSLYEGANAKDHPLPSTYDTPLAADASGNLYFTGQSSTRDLFYQLSLDGILHRFTAPLPSTQPSPVPPIKDLDVDADGTPYFLAGQSLWKMNPDRTYQVLPSPDRPIENFVLIPGGYVWPDWRGSLLLQKRDWDIGRLYLLKQSKPSSKKIVHFAYDEKTDALYLLFAPWSEQSGTILEREDYTLWRMKGAAQAQPATVLNWVTY